MHVRDFTEKPFIGWKFPSPDNLKGKETEIRLMEIKKLRKVKYIRISHLFSNFMVTSPFDP